MAQLRIRNALRSEALALTLGSAIKCTGLKTLFLEFLVRPTAADLQGVIIVQGGVTTLEDNLDNFNSVIVPDDGTVTMLTDTGLSWDPSFASLTVSSPAAGVTSRAVVAFADPTRLLRAAWIYVGGSAGFVVRANAYGTGQGTTP